MRGSGNVFADLGFRQPGAGATESSPYSANLPNDQGQWSDPGRGWSDPWIKQPHVSGLMRGQSGNFSVGRLMEFLTALGQDVEITVRPTRKQHGEMSVTVL
jgi:hypothetical protein